MRSYFSDEDEILAYEDTRSEPSYQELYKIYKPLKYVITETLKEQRKRQYEIMGEKRAIQDRLALVVPNAQIEFATILSTISYRKEEEQLADLISLNECIFRIISGQYSAEAVKDIPMTDFIQFKKRWAKCPFHADTKPSFYYYPKQNRAHCFSGCGQKNVIQVYAVLNNLHNSDAFRQLKERLV